VGVDVVEAVEQSSRTFDLDAGEPAGGVNDEVVTLAVAVGLGDGEAQASGLEQESQFGKLSAKLGGEFARGTPGVWKAALGFRLRALGSWVRAWRSGEAAFGYGLWAFGARLLAYGCSVGHD
jgi:hypothetical protein